MGETIKWTAETLHGLPSFHGNERKRLSDPIPRSESGVAEVMGDRAVKIIFATRFGVLAFVLLGCAIGVQKVNEIELVYNHRLELELAIRRLMATQQEPIEEFVMKSNIPDNLAEARCQVKRLRHPLVGGYSTGDLSVAHLTILSSTGLSSHECFASIRLQFFPEDLPLRKGSDVRVLFTQDGQFYDVEVLAQK